MKKLLTIWAAALALLGLMAAPALAAGYPVYFGGELIGTAEVSQNTTMLPMRVIFEACNAQVDWYPVGKQIVATKADNGHKISLRVGSKTAMDDSDKTEYQLAVAPYVKGGVTYVPVRFVAEALGCDVKWLPDKKRVEIKAANLLAISGVEGDLQFDPNTGEIYRGGSLLTQAPLLSSGNWPNAAEGSMTIGGNYLVDLVYVVSGAITVQEHEYVWINAATGQSYAVIEKPWLADNHAPFFNGDKIWLAGDNQAYLIDDKAGKLIKEYDLQSYIASYNAEHNNNDNALVVWADDDYALLRNDYNTWWALLDLRMDEVRRIDGELLTAEVKQQVNEILWPLIKDYPLREDYAADEEYTEFFWGVLAKWYSQIDAHLVLDFVEAKGNILNFTITVYGENFAEKGSVPISYQYK